MKVKTNSLVIGILLGVMVMFLVGAGEDNKEEKVSRYEIKPGGYTLSVRDKMGARTFYENHATFKIDTITGQVWKYYVELDQNHNQVKAGFVFVKVD